MKLHMLEPRATEKTYMAQTLRTYAFFVDAKDTKQEIAKKVAKEFNVTVTDVRVLVRDGKKTKFSKGKHAYPGTTFRRDHKLAYVTLKEGDKIKVFETENEQAETKPSLAKKEDKKAKEAVKSDAKEAKKAEKTTKKADKNAAKENK